MKLRFLYIGISYYNKRKNIGEQTENHEKVNYLRIT